MLVKPRHLDAIERIGVVLKPELADFRIPPGNRRTLSKDEAVPRQRQLVLRRIAGNIHAGRSVRRGGGEHVRDLFGEALGHGVHVGHTVLQHDGIEPRRPDIEMQEHGAVPLLVGEGRPAGILEKELRPVALFLVGMIKL